jgi:tetratricopeptide (TPR) repeat protein
LEESRDRYNEAGSLRAELLAVADRSGSPRLRSQIYSEQARLLARSEQYTEAAEYDIRALSSAPEDPELRGYLYYQAGSHALAHRDFTSGIRSMQLAAEYYRGAFGPDARQLADVDYTIAQALHMAGESAAALARADASVRENQSFGDQLQISIALYLRSAIHLRLGAADLAIQDAEAAISVLPPPESSPDMAMWQTIMKTARVEALVGFGAFDEAIGSGAAVSRQLEADPRLDIGGQSDELQLATALAWLGKGQPREAARALTRADAPGFLEHDAFKHAESLLLRADLPGVPPQHREGLRAEALALLAELGSDGASRIATARLVCSSSG